MVSLVAMVQIIDATYQAAYLGSHILGLCATVYTSYDERASVQIQACQV